VARILLIDDDEDLTHYLDSELTERGHQVECLDLAESGPDLLAQGDYDLVLLDNRMPRMSGIEFLDAVQQRGLRVPVILMTSHATTDIAIQAMNLGAFDYVIKPFDLDELCRELEPLITRAAAITRAMKEHVRLPGQAAPDSARRVAAGPVLLGNSKSMLEVYKLIGRFARGAAAVLVLGETGTGKELVARAIHSNSPRKNKPFVVFDCNAPDGAALDELFGHEAGAFPGADKLRKGSFEHANGGTLFLDKVSDLPLNLQAKVLHVLESREVHRRGGREAIAVDVRLVAATRSDLDAAVREGRFREDLFYRLQEVTIRLPVLRERGADLQVLAEHFAIRAAEEAGRPTPTFLESAWEKLRGYSWSGNVRELQNVIRRAVLVSRGPHLAPADLDLGAALPSSASQETAASRSHDRSPGGEEEEALTGLRQAIRWVLRSGRPNPSRLLHDLLDQELSRAMLTHPGEKTPPGSGLVELLQSLRSSGVLEPEQQLELDSRPPATATPQELAEELLRRGWLTPWQLEQLLGGRSQDLVLGQYVLLDVLGQGGMGVVFKGRQRRLKRLTALKVIRPERLTSPSAVQRFHRETEAAARLAHPHIVQIYDAGEVNGRHFLAMEYVEGTDLARLLGKQGPFPVLQACDLVRQAALGLHHAHERGLVHRDIKPSNLLVTARGGLLKILDMGLARLAPSAEGGLTADHLTQSGAVLGTPDYIAPEQALHAGTVDLRADLYSLGCTLYHCLAGRAPFAGDSVTQKLLKHQLESPPPLETVRPDVPPPLAQVVSRLMAKRPEDRFQTAAAVAAALERPVSLSGSIS
jgi:DNA-binding NtrC family response regulator/tRNA A-37 threonylcarbamoyl transferase component Bud32